MKAVDAGLPALAAVVVLTVLVTGEAVLAAAGKLSRRGNSPDYVCFFAFEADASRQLTNSNCTNAVHVWLQLPTIGMRVGPLQELLHLVLHVCHVQVGFYHQKHQAVKPEGDVTALITQKLAKL